MFPGGRRASDSEALDPLDPNHGEQHTSMSVPLPMLGEYPAPRSQTIEARCQTHLSTIIQG